MKLKRKLGIALLTAVMTVAASLCTAYAAERVIYDEVMNNVYERDGLEVNWWGNLHAKEGFDEGKCWGASYGAKDLFSDAPDGSLAVHPWVNGSGETGIGRGIIADPLPEGSSIEYTIDFTTGSAPKDSNCEIWVDLNDSHIFMYKNMAGLEPELGFASTTSWPFTAKSFDRDPNNMSVDFDTRYTLKMTVKPTSSKFCRFVAELYNADGDKLATGIINEWTNFTPKMLENIYGLGITVRHYSTAKKETTMYFHRITIKGIYDEKKPDAEFYPENNSVDNALDTECYIQFANAMNDIAPEDISISDGAVVDGVEMKDGGKKAEISLSGLKANKKYTVTVNNVGAAELENTYSYTWSFTTGGSTEFGKPYFVGDGIFKQEMKNLNLDGLAAEGDSEYAAGNAWSILDATRKDAFYSVDKNGVLWIKNPPHVNGDSNSENRLAHKFDKISDGESFKVSAVLNIKDPGYNSEYNIRLIRDGATSRDQYGNYATDSVTLLRVQSMNGAWGKTLGLQNYTQPFIDDSTEKAFLSDEDGWFKFDKLDGESYLTVTFTPDAEDSEYYKAVTVLTNNGVEYRAESKIPKNIVLSLDRIQIFELNFGSDNTDVLGIKNITIEKNSGLILGTNTAYIDFKNLDADSTFDADILIVEHKPDADGNYGTVKNITVVSKKDITETEGTFECEFEVKDTESEFDFYVFNSIDDSFLISDGAVIKAD